MFGGVLGRKLLPGVENSLAMQADWMERLEKQQQLQAQVPPESAVAAPALETSGQQLQQAAPPSGVAMHWQHVRDIIRQEMASTLGNQPQTRPMQLIINNRSEATVQQSAPEPSPPGPHETWMELLSTFLASPVNRVGLLTVVGLGLYIYQGHLNHKWRMAEMQRRIDANPFLRLSKMIAAP